MTTMMTHASAMLAVLGRHEIPLSDLAHVTDRGGGPCQPNAIWPVKESFLSISRVRIPAIDDRAADFGGVDGPEAPEFGTRNGQRPPAVFGTSTYVATC